MLLATQKPFLCCLTSGSGGKAFPSSYTSKPFCMGGPTVITSAFAVFISLACSVPPRLSARGFNHVYNFQDFPRSPDPHVRKEAQAELPNVDPSAHLPAPKIRMVGLLSFVRATKTPDAGKFIYTAQHIFIAHIALYSEPVILNSMLRCFFMFTKGPLSLEQGSKPYCFFIRRHFHRVYHTA